MVKPINVMQTSFSFLNMSEISKSPQYLQLCIDCGFALVKVDAEYQPQPECNQPASQPSWQVPYPFDDLRKRIFLIMLCNMFG
jgi:hypothetical protein